jgi:hypothetical protein
MALHPAMSNHPRIDLSPKGRWRRSKFGEPAFILLSDAYLPSRQNWR